MKYGGRRFHDFSQHPNDPVPITSGPNAGQTSTAAGRYQFLKGTWDEAANALGLTDFSPANQDRAAWWLAQRDYAKRTGGRTLADDLKSTDPAMRANIGRVLSGTWTSLPGGIETSTNGGRFGSELEANMRRQQRAQMIHGAKSGPEPSLPSLSTPGPMAAANAAGSIHTITMDFNGVPQGATVRTQSQGDGAEIGGVRIRRAMPEAGFNPALGGT